MRKPKSDYVIQTVTNALSLLEVFGGEEELGVTELSRRLDLHKNNVFRLLATLEQKGYVEQSRDSDRYRLGVRCLDLGQSFERNRSLLREGRSVVEELVGGLEETAHLGVLRDYQVAHLDGEAPDRLIAAGCRTGSRLPVHCTALGKVLLAHTEPAVRERYDRQYVASNRLEGCTPRTILDREKLFEHLRAVSARGFALDIEEAASGLCCAAAPVYDATGRSVAALSVSGPSFRLDADALLDHVAPAVVSAAERLSSRLGFGSTTAS